MWDDILAFLTRLKSQWVLVLTSTALALVPVFFERSIGPLAAWGFWLLVGLGTLWALFRVWRFERHDGLRLKAENRTLQAQLHRLEEQMAQNAPSVIVEYLGPKGGGEHPVLRNVSPVGAYNVRIAPIPLGNRRAEFENVPHIPAGGAVEVRPYIHNISAPFLDKLHSALEFPFAQSPAFTVSPEVPVNFDVSYADQSGKPFRTTTSITYSSTLRKTVETTVRLSEKE